MHAIKGNIYQRSLFAIYECNVNNWNISWRCCSETERWTQQINVSMTSLNVLTTLMWLRGPRTWAHSEDRTPQLRTPFFVRIYDFHVQILTGGPNVTHYALCLSVTEAFRNNRSFRNNLGLFYSRHDDAQMLFHWARFQIYLFNQLFSIAGSHFALIIWWSHRVLFIL
jgi:hypothetical protein